MRGAKDVGKYIVKRVLLAILTVFIICAITFFTMHAVPGGPFNREKALSEATIAALNVRYGLDKPLGEQFLLYMKGVLHGDFGVSLKNGREISAIIGESFPISARLGLSAMVVALICGTVFGSTAALMRNKLPDRIIVFFSTLFTAVPSFILATLLLLALQPAHYDELTRILIICVAPLAAHFMTLTNTRVTNVAVIGALALTLLLTLVNLWRPSLSF